MPDEKPEAVPPSDAPHADAAAPDGVSTPSETPAADVASESEAVRSDAAPAETPAKKRRKKRKKVEEVEETGPVRDSIGDDGRERPAFLLGFPADPELEQLMRAFELGDYARVRKGAPELAERTKDVTIRAAAEELARRIEPDPLVKILLGFSIVLLVLLTLWAYKTHGV